MEYTSRFGLDLRPESFGNNKKGSNYQAVISSFSLLTCSPVIKTSGYKVFLYKCHLDP